MTQSNITKADMDAACEYLRDRDTLAMSIETLAKHFSKHREATTPTQWAYDKACEALHKKQQQVDDLVATLVWAKKHMMHPNFNKDFKELTPTGQAMVEQSWFNVLEDVDELLTKHKERINDGN